MDSQHDPQNHGKKEYNYKPFEENGDERIQVNSEISNTISIHHIIVRILVPYKFTHGRSLSLTISYFSGVILAIFLGRAFYILFHNLDRDYATVGGIITFIFITFIARVLCQVSGAIIDINAKIKSK